MSYINQIVEDGVTYDIAAKNLVNGFTQTTAGVNALDAAAGKTLNDDISSLNTNLATTNTELAKRTQSLRYVQTTGYITTSVSIPANSTGTVTTNVSFPTTNTLVAIIPTYMGLNCVAVNAYVDGTSHYICFTLRNLTSTARTYDSSTNLAFTILYK